MLTLSGTLEEWKWSVTLPRLGRFHVFAVSVLADIHPTARANQLVAASKDYPSTQSQEKAESAAKVQVLDGEQIPNTCTHRPAH